MNQRIYFGERKMGVSINKEIYKYSLWLPFKYFEISEEISETTSLDWVHAYFFLFLCKQLKGRQFFKIIIM